MIYPELAKLMASKSMKVKHIAEIIDKKIPTTSKKLNGKIDFKMNELFKITAYFKQFYPSLTIEKIFSLIEIFTPETNVDIFLHR